MKEIKIGNQIWMLENLNLECFSNGDPIHEAKTTEEWEEAGRNKKPLYMYHDWTSSRGKMYNWFAVNDPRGLALEGWKVPSEADWEDLINFVGGSEHAGKKLKSSSFEWEEIGGEDEFGMCIRPGGFMGSWGLAPFRWYIHFWTSTGGEGIDDDYAFSFVFDGCSDESRKSFSHKSSGNYLRLIKQT